MARLIDADALFTFFCKFGNDAEWDTRGILYAIFTAPTVDAVPVVRCRDCKHWNVSADKTMTWCSRLRSVETIEDDFCSFGERRDAE